jgi:hypothetical protein
MMRSPNSIDHVQTSTLSAFALIAILTCFFGLSTGSAQTSVGTEIVSLGTEKCLDVAGASAISGADVNQYRCHEGSNQKWTAHNAATPGYVYFVNQNSSLCLDVRIGGPKDGTLQQYTCHYRDNQLFRLEPRVDSVGGVRIIAKHSNDCLDVPGASNQDGLLIQQYPCHLGSNQRWVYTDRGPYRFPVTATPIGRRTLSLQEKKSYSFSLSNLTAGVVPVIHLWSQTRGNVTPLGQVFLPGGAQTLNYSVPPGSGGSFTLYVHARAGSSPGTAILTVRQDNTVVGLYPDFPVGGTTVDVPDSTAESQFRYQTAALPGGGNDTLILALDNLNYLQEFDYSRFDHAPQITGARITQIVVASMDSINRPAVLYANDVFRDNDHDGLGYGLERELGTCDLRHAQPHCEGVFNTRDTDRDGIEDGVEVLGVEDGNLAFPSWGANPLHKDLFVEADWTTEFDRTPLNQERIRRLQFHLAHGPAAHLDNPDGIDGIALHVDAGITPTDPTDRTLYGDWGGAGPVTLAAWQASYPAPPAGSFDSRRLPYFRQLLLVKAGGQNGFGRFWYATGEDPDTIMHEFGHTLGLQHESVVPGPNGPVIHGLNCSPAYPSVMSYATPHATFLTGDDFPPEGINPSNLCETDGLGSGVPDLSFVTSSLGGIPVESSTGRIDWNRDGAFSGTAPRGSASRCRPGERVRAVINWGYSGCDAHTQGSITLSPQTASPARSDGGEVLGGPAIARVGPRLYVFYIKRNASGGQQLFYQSAAIGPKSTAGCTDGFRVYTNGNSDPCMHFAGPFLITPSETTGAPIVPARIALFSLGDSLQVALADTSGQIRTFMLSSSVLEAGRASQDAFPEPALRDTSGVAVTTDSDLSLVVIGLDVATFPGTGRHLALYYVDRSGAVRWASKEYGTAAAFTDRGVARDASATPLVTVPGDAPALASWTHLGSLDDLEVVMVLQGQDARFKLYRYDRAHNRWSDITQAAFSQEAVQGPGHNQKIAFWFQPILDSNGDIIERGKGFFSILFRYGTGSLGAPAWSTPSMWRSDNLSRLQPPAQNLSFHVFQKFGNDWYAVRGNNYPLGLGGGFAVYSDETMPGLKAGLVNAHGDPEHGYEHDLIFLPFADGIFDMAFKPSPDFKVMEGTLCRAMRGESFCGNPQQTKWGF